MLYEPGHAARGSVSRGHLPPLQALIDQNKPAETLEFAMTKIGGMTRGDVDELKRTPLWPSMIRIVPVFPRAMPFLDQLTWTRKQRQALRCRTWMLLGSLSKPRPGDEESWVAALVDRIPGMTLYPLMGQGHVAYLSDPVLLAKVVERGLTDQ